MYVLHSLPDTAALAVQLVLEELGQPYRIAALDRAAGQQDTPAYRALQPLGLIPALETPDGPMFETAAILLWLADRHGALAPAPADPTRAAFLKWFFFTAHAVHPTLLQIFYPERAAGPACAGAALTHAARRMTGYLALLETMAAADRPHWLAPGAASILGYYLGMLLHWLRDLPPDHPGHLATTDYPALHAVLAALETRDATRTVAQTQSLALPLFISAC